MIKTIKKALSILCALTLILGTIVPTIANAELKKNGAIQINVITKNAAGDLIAGEELAAQLTYKLVRLSDGHEIISGPGQTGGGVAAVDPNLYQVGWYSLHYDATIPGDNYRIEFTLPDNLGIDRAYKQNNNIELLTSKTLTRVYAIPVINYSLLLKVADSQSYIPVATPEIIDVGGTYDLTDNVTFTDNDGNPATPPTSEFEGQTFPVTYKDVTPEGTIDVNTPGEYIGKVEVTYADESKEIVDVPVTVKEKAKEKLPVPVVNEPVYEGDRTISGTGTPGAELRLTGLAGLGGYIGYIVKDDGTWEIQLPDDVTLVKDNVFNAYQVDPDNVKADSDVVKTTVQAKVQEQSAAPGINPVTEGDRTISGTGVAGSKIDITLPNASGFKDVEVKADGTWTVTLPDGAADLNAGDKITATQTEPGKTESPEATAVVKEKPVSADPSINQVVEGATKIDGKGVPGAEVSVSIPGVTDPVKVTVKEDGTWTVDVPEGTELKPGDVIKATQTEPNKKPSEEVTTKVTSEGQSAEPVINQPTEGDTKVTGTGVPGATVTVTLPNGKTVETKVDDNGKWSVDTDKLNAGEIVKAIQTEAGKSASNEVQKNVRRNVIIDNNRDPINPFPVKDTGEHYAYIVGYPGNIVKPDGSLTRAEAATMFAKLLAYETGDKIANATSTGFSDSEDTWYTDFVKYVADKGVMKGYPDGSFGPERQITRAELVTMIANFENVTLNATPFTDIDGHWAKTFIEEVYTSGKISGDLAPDGSRVFRPDDNIKRVEAASIFNAFYNRRVDEAGVGTLEVKAFEDLNKAHWGYYTMVEATNNHKFERKEAGKIMEVWKSLFEGTFFQK